MKEVLPRLFTFRQACPEQGRRAQDEREGLKETMGFPFRLSLLKYVMIALQPSLRRYTNTLWPPLFSSRQ